jgi:hypothetical protein
MSETHTPIPPEVNSLPNFVARLEAHFSRWPKGIVPIDKDDVMRLLSAVKQTYDGGQVRHPAAEIAPPGAQT